MTGWNITPATAVAAVLIAASAAPALASDSSAFRKLSGAEWAWRQEQFADSEDSAAGARAGRLPDVSEAAQQRRLAYWLEIERKLARIDRKRLKPAEQVDFDVYRSQIATLIDGQRFRTYEMPLNSDSSFWGDLAYAADRTYRTEAEYQAYIGQLEAIPAYVEANIANMRAGLKRGFTPARITLEGREAGAASVAQAASPEASIFYRPFQRMPAQIPAERQAALRAAAVTAIRDRVIPAHQAIVTFMRSEYIPGARRTLGASELPDGLAYYRSRIREYTTLDLAPDEVHQIGLAEVAKIRTEMLAVMQEVGFQGDLAAFLHHLRTDPRFYAKTPQELLDRAAWLSKSFDAKAGDWFGRLPRQRFAIKPVPADIAPFYTSGRGGPGIYLVNTYDLASRPLYSLAALTLHESAPGHAFQMPLALENQGLPGFRQHTYISAYGEGWALYSERLGVEMGMYETPYDRFGMLSYQMWRAARLVVDTGIHAKGWSREQGQAFLRDNTALSETEIRTEVDRYISWPGQALSYYLGQMAIFEARARAEKALGPAFDIRAFHDAVLELGSVPLPVLHARIDRFIAEGGKSPFDQAD